MAEPLAACVHAVARAGGASPCLVLGGGTIGLMVTRLLVLEGRDVALADRHAERRAQAEAWGARPLTAAEGGWPLVLECAGRPEAWHAAVAATAPGGTCVLVGGCAGDVALPAQALHYDEVDVRGAFHHDRGEVDRALALLAEGAVDWRALAAPAVGLGGLAGALGAMPGGAARKPVVEPWR
jgi:L-iditol 2-dehydrogenase